MGNVGRDIIYSAKLYTVVGEETGKRGKTLLIVRMADGTERKIENNAMVQFRDVPQFAPASSMNEIMADVSRERQQRRHEGIYYQNRALADR